MLTRRSLLGIAAATTGAGLASRGLAQLLNGAVDASQLGVTQGNDIGAALNRAIAQVAKDGGGVLRLDGGLYGTRDPIILQTGVTLKGTGETTLYASAPIGDAKAKRSLIEQPDGTARCGLADILLDCRNQVEFAAWRAVAPRETTCTGVVMRGWTFGVYFVSTADSSADGVTFRDTIIHQGADRQIYPAFLSSTTGGKPFRNLLIERMTLAGTGGSYSPTNAATADQLTMQNVRGFVLRDVISRDGGENGMSIVRGCRDGEMSNIIVTGADGQGCQIGGGGLEVTVSDPAPFAKGLRVQGLESGAEAIVDLVAGNQVWLSRLMRRQFSPAEEIVCGGQRVRMSDPQFCRNIALDGLKASRNGRNAAAIKGAFADLYITHAEDITVRNARIGGAQGHGLLVNNSRNVPCALSGALGNDGPSRRGGPVVCAA